MINANNIFLIILNPPFPICFLLNGLFVIPQNLSNSALVLLISARFEGKPMN